MTIEERTQDLRKALHASRETCRQLEAALQRADTMRERDYVQLVAQGQLLEQERIKSRILWQRVQELEASTSWRLTRPIRAVSMSLQATMLKLLGSPGRFRRQLFLGREIIRTNGLQNFLERLQRKLWRRYQGVVLRTRPGSLEIEKEWRPLRLHRDETPQVSVIIPAHNHFAHTFTCLKSLSREHPRLGAPPFEIIIVDDASQDQTPGMLAAMEGLRIVQNTQQLGFIASCNRGARQARGRYLVFLNNDTVVPTKTLAHVVQTFAKWPEAGLVGGKLVYPDGRLQEAGGLVWRDGSAWNYGHGDDPAAPAYNYVREVDYCSGAFLAIPRDLFDAVGGFSERYKPAYYEDTDLAFKVRKAGRKVIYQPAIEIIHFEGISNGSDLSSGVKRYQQINQLKFAHKWRTALEQHQHNGVLPEIERDRGKRGRILVIDIYMPTPDRDSGSVRMVRLLELMCALEMKVTFIADNLEHRPPYSTRLQQMGVEVLYAPYVQSIRHFLRRHGRNFDIIVLSRSGVAENYARAVRQFAPCARLIFDTVDLRFLRESRQAALESDPRLTKSADLQKELELDLVRTADITLVVSDVEKQVLYQAVPTAQVEILSNIHDVVDHVRPFAERSGILFVGNFNHPPNSDAVDHFVRRILPRVSAALGDVTFYVIGDAVPPKVLQLASQAVIFTGYIEEISGYFQKCKMSVAPLRYGAGVKGKINQSMAHGLPVVSTPMGVEGMHLVHGQDVLIAEEPAAFAQQVIALYRDQDLWQRLSRNGRRNVAAHFSPHVAQQALARILERT